MSGVSVNKTKHLPVEEWFAEFEWLLENGSSVFMACESMGKSMATAERYCDRYGRHDLSRLICRATQNIKQFDKTLVSTKT
jgi:hypothetical protein